jgi:hypothetical protein
MHKCAVSLHSTHLLLPLELSEPAARAPHPAAVALRSGRSSLAARARPQRRRGGVDRTTKQRRSAERTPQRSGREAAGARRGRKRASSPRRRALGPSDDEAGQGGQRATALGREGGGRRSTRREASRTTARRGPRGGRRPGRAALLPWSLGITVFGLQEPNPRNG